MKSKVLLVGLASGLNLGNLGFTHCSIEEIGVLRSIPNIQIVVPADCLEPIKAVEFYLSKSENPIYLRLTGGANIKQIYKKDYNFEIGKAEILKEGSDICFFLRNNIKQCFGSFTNFGKRIQNSIKGS